MSIFDDVLSCGQELKQKTLGGAINGDFEKVLAIFLDGSIRTLQAIALLYDNKFYEEGYSLTRILLEAVVDLWYINLDKNNRAEQYIDFDKFKANEQVDMLRGLNPSLDSQTKFSIKSKFKNKTSWSQLNFEEMLKTIYPNQKREVDSHRLLYRYLCSFSHPSASGLGSTTVFAKEDMALWEKRDEHSKEVLPLLSCQLALAIYFTIDREFSLGYSTQINKINDEISHLVAKKNIK
jgi:hypothetical protein